MQQVLCWTLLSSLKRKIFNHLGMEIRPYQIHKTEEHFLDNVKPLKPRQSKKRKTNISRAQERDLGNC